MFTNAWRNGINELKPKQGGGVVTQNCIVKNQRDEEVIISSLSVFVANKPE